MDQKNELRELAEEEIAAISGGVTFVCSSVNTSPENSQTPATGPTPAPAANGAGAGQATASPGAQNTSAG
jgi:dihydroorotase-like cyclic amidohydrolase